ncbi:hypothetical protein SAMN05421736_12438 [Evansella caseinilytica]|uniref:Uncharacterized protein n=1 Tax=Evansella caseinilytica TaxID=1503961 RepID=A0A1H3UR29_9BACI|nr:hypothetical protein [Evansella caseinilytica]SDZ64345.1 hypothetical protein SAMN05421736_12438 [Evansella caseinilytica]
MENREWKRGISVYPPAANRAVRLFLLIALIALVFPVSMEPDSRGKSAEQLIGMSVLTEDAGSTSSPDDAADPSFSSLHNIDFHFFQVDNLLFRLHHDHHVKAKLLETLMYIKNKGDCFSLYSFG